MTAQTSERELLALKRLYDFATGELRNTSSLMSNPPQSAAAWDIRNAIQREIDALPNASALEQQADEATTRLYRKFKEWSERGFGPDDVTWCEVKAEITNLLNAAARAAGDAPVADLPPALVGAIVAAMGQRCRLMPDDDSKAQARRDLNAVIAWADSRAAVSHARPERSTEVSAPASPDALAPVQSHRG